MQRNKGFNIVLASAALLTTVFAVQAQSAYADLTFGATTVSSNGALTLTGAGASVWDIGNNTLSLQTAGNGAITTGTGTVTAGGDVVVTGTFSVGGGTALTTTNKTGTGNLVLSTSPTLVTPVFGTPTSVTLTNGTGLPISTGVSGLGAGVATFLGTASSANLATAISDETGTGLAVFATSPTLVTPVLGTPTSVTLTNGTGLPISTGVSGLGAGVATFLGTASSANLASAVSDETGTGLAVFATSPTLVTPVLGTPTSVTLTNATGLPIGTGVSGLGAGVATFLGTASSANLASAISDETGTGAAVFANTPTLVTPNIGVASATSVNGLTITGTTGTLTLAAGKTLTSSNTLTFTGTDASSVNFGTGGTVAYTGSNLGAFAATTSAQLAGVLSDETGSGAAVFATSPTLVTPNIGVASATSVNGLTITGTTGTLTLAAGKTLTASNTLTFTGTDASSVNFGTGGTVVYTGSNLGAFAATTSAQLAGVLSDETGTGLAVFGTSPVLVTPDLGIPSVLTLTNATGLPISTGVSGLGAGVATFLGTASSANLASAISDETGTGAAVFANTPTLVTPNIGVASATSVNGLTITGTTGTLTLAAGKTLTSSNTLTLTGTDASSVDFGAGGTVLYTASNLGVFAATTSAQLAGVLSDETGTGLAVFGTSPTLTTPNIGAATATTINGNTFTAGTGTLTLGAGKTLTASNTLTFTGTDASSVNFGTGGTVVYTGTDLSVFAATTSAQLAGVLSDETGTGAAVFATSPTLVTPALGVATATSVAIGGGTAITKMTVGNLASGASGWIPNGVAGSGLVTFTITADNTSVGANSLISVSLGANATPTTCAVSGRTAGANFIVKCSSDADATAAPDAAATLQYMIVN